MLDNSVPQVQFRDSGAIAYGRFMYEMMKHIEREMGTPFEIPEPVTDEEWIAFGESVEEALEDEDID